MATSLASDPHYPIPDPAVVIATTTEGVYDLKPHSGSPWSPAADVPQVPKGSAHARSFQQAPHAKVRFLNRADARGRQSEERRGNLLDTVNAFDDRIAVLKEQAAIEGNFLNSRSIETFLDFIKSNPLIRLGSLFLLESGNLRAVWKGDNASHVGLQFLDNGLIQYVLFRQRHADVPVSRAYGRDTPPGVLAQISALKLDQALYR